MSRRISSLDSTAVGIDRDISSQYDNVKIVADNIVDVEIVAVITSYSIHYTKLYDIWFTFAKKSGSKDIGIRPIKDKMHRFVTGVQPKFKQNKVWLPKPELTHTISPRLGVLVKELTHELSRFTLAGGVKALAHDDAIDLFNQLSEIDVV